MSTETYGPATINGLSISQITVTETDIGNTGTFNPAPFSTFSDTLPYDGQPQPLFSGVSWAGFGAGAFGAGSSQVLEFDYSVSASGGLDITGIAG